MEAAAASKLYCLVGALQVLGSLLSLTSAGSFRMVMAEKIQTVLLNSNATISCKVPGFPYVNIQIVAVTWFWKNQVDGTEVKVFESSRNHRKAFRSGASVSPQRLAKGDASLELPGVQLREAGEYRCEVVITRDKGQGTAFLEVVGSEQKSGSHVTFCWITVACFVALGLILTILL